MGAGYQQKSDANCRISNLLENRRLRRAIGLDHANRNDFHKHNAKPIATGGIGGRLSNAAVTRMSRVAAAQCAVSS